MLKIVAFLGLLVSLSGCAGVCYPVWPGFACNTYPYAPIYGPVYGPGYYYDRY